MGVLDKVAQSEPIAPCITIYGAPGIGKSTLAATFPNPLFLLTEETGLQGIEYLPIAETFEAFWDNVKQLSELDKIPYKTLVVDSVSKLDALVVAYILKKEANGKHANKAPSLASACGGFGAGYGAAQELHRALKFMFDKLRAKGITIIFVSHSAIIKHKSPENDDYDIYSIVMNHDKSREIYINDVDAVLFCKLKYFTNENDSGRIIVKSTDQRVIATTVNAAYVSKNRFNLPPEINLDSENMFEQLSKYIPFFNKTKTITTEDK